MITKGGKAVMGKKGKLESEYLKSLSSKKREKYRRRLELHKKYRDSKK
jgi:hypothetical protein